MSDLTDEELKRVRQVRWAATGSNFDNFPATKADVRLLAVRLEALEMAEHAVSEEMLRWMLERLKEDRQSHREWLADLIEQCRIAELQALEADEAVKAVEALIGGGMHVHGDEIIKRWDAVAEDFKRRGLLPADPEPAPLPQSPPAGAADSEPPLPANLIAQLSKPAQVALAPSPSPRAPGALSYTGAGDPLTEKQANVFQAILSASDVNWRAVISQGRIAKVSGEKAGGMWAHLDALEKKDFIRILDRGNSTTPGSYLICERARPAREAPPKTDAELIAEAIAAGRVTKVDAPGVVH